MSAETRGTSGNDYSPFSRRTNCLSVTLSGQQGKWKFNSFKGECERERKWPLLLSLHWSRVKGVRVWREHNLESEPFYSGFLCFINWTKLFLDIRSLEILICLVYFMLPPQKTYISLKFLLIADRDYPYPQTLISANHKLFFLSLLQISQGTVISLGSHSSWVLKLSQNVTFCLSGHRIFFYPGLNIPLAISQFLNSNSEKAK